MAKPNEKMLWPLPSNDGPWDYTPVCVYIPNDEQHRRNFLGAVLALSKWYNYDRDDLHRGTIAASAWDYTFAQLATAITSGEGCGEDMACCDDLLVIVQKMVDESYANTIGALPVSVIAPAAPNKTFVTSTNTTTGLEQAKRMRSLCSVIYNYMGAVINNIGKFVTDSLTLENLLGIRDIFTEIPLTGITQAGIALIISPAIITAFQDEDAIREFICCWRDMLSNLADASFTSFNHSIEQMTCDWDNQHAQEIANIMAFANRDERNYKIFIAALGDEYSRDISTSTNTTGDCDFCGDACTVYRNLGASPFGVNVIQGIWEPGVGFKGEPITINTVAWTQLKLEIMCPSVGNVRTVELDVAYKNNGGGNALFIGTKNGTTQTAESGGIGGGTNVRGITTWTTPNQQFTADRITVRQMTAVSTGSITVYGVKSGAGNPPLP